MLIYAVLNLVVLAALALVLAIWPRPIAWRPTVVIALILLGMTAVFDSCIVGYHIVAYDQLKILGVYIGKAPLEDFAYTLAAVVLIPYLWKLYDRKN